MLHILVQFKSTKQFKITVCVNTNVYVHFTVLHVCVHTVSVTVCVCEPCAYRFRLCGSQPQCPMWS